MSSVLVLAVVGLARGMGGLLRRLLIRLSVSLFVNIVPSLLSAGSRGRRVQPVHDHATGDGPKDQRASEQDGSDHAKAAEDAPHHVITNYQRRSATERSIEIARRGVGQPSAAYLGSQDPATASGRASIRQGRPVPPRTQSITPGSESFWRCSDEPDGAWIDEDAEAK
jgi:hypothetical protein